ncbi:site-specific integrase [Metabacillus idriensis]|uniref:site-specific integrase n=1 Tax=Metabacillus idriensis TaxID=324768 RepID=UPI00174EAEA0|nr:tyrosine-type recombinase/integrase [Metabacillus idriensis]
MASFRKRNDKWEYRIKYIDPATGNKREKSKGGFATKKEAQIMAAEIERRIYLGQHSIINSSEILVKDWLNKWLDVYCTQCEKSTLINRTNYVQKVIIPKLGNFKLNSLSRIEYQEFMNTLLEKYAKRTVQTIHSIFMSAINKAVEAEIITHNKFRNINIKKESNLTDKKINYLDKEQVAIFMNAARQAPFHHYIVASFLLRTGLRKGELLGLTWNDIDFQKKTVNINKSRNENEVKKPKTNSSYRKISIDETLIDELIKYSLWQKKNKLKYGLGYRNSEFLITSPNGKAIGPFGINKIIDNILEKTNLHHISPHGLRHTHAIMLLESGADIKFVSDRLGHSTVNMTADVYVHITKKYEEENVSKFAKYLNH